jgi:hypothetical protein
MTHLDGVGERAARRGPGMASRSRLPRTPWRRVGHSLVIGVGLASFGSAVRAFLRLEPHVSTGTIGLYLLTVLLAPCLFCGLIPPPSSLGPLDWIDRTRHEVGYAANVQPHAFCSLTLVPNRNTLSNLSAPSSGSNCPTAPTLRAVVLPTSLSVKPMALARPSRS